MRWAWLLPAHAASTGFLGARAGVCAVRRAREAELLACRGFFLGWFSLGLTTTGGSVLALLAGACAIAADALNPTQSAARELTERKADRMIALLERRVPKT